MFEVIKMTYWEKIRKAKYQKVMPCRVCKKRIPVKVIETLRPSNYHDYHYTNEKTEEVVNIFLQTYRATFERMEGTIFFPRNTRVINIQTPLHKWWCICSDKCEILYKLVEM